MHTKVLQAVMYGEVLYDYRESGNSMQPKIKHRQPVTIHPVNTELIEAGDIVIAKVHGRIFMHNVAEVRGDSVQIANNKGHVNGWTPRSKIYGIVTHVEGRPIPKAISKIRLADD